MSDNSPNEAVRRLRQPLLEIEMPDGDPLILRHHFAKVKVGVSDRTARRMNLPTVYVGGFPYVKCKASLKILADQAKRKNQPTKRRRV